MAFGRIWIAWWKSIPVCITALLQNILEQLSFIRQAHRWQLQTPIAGIAKCLNNAQSLCHAHFSDNFLPIARPEPDPFPRHLPAGMSKKKYATEVIVHHSASSLFAAKVRDRFITMLIHSSRGTLKEMVSRL